VHSDLSALEALGGVTNICSDKTGTLTRGAMIVRKVWLPSSDIYTVRDSMDPRDPTQGTVTRGRAKSNDDMVQEKRDFDEERTTQAVRFDVPAKKLNEANLESEKKKEYEEPEAELTPDLRMFLLSAALCNVSTVRYDEGENKWQTTGEPTEIALQVFAHRFDHGRKKLKEAGWMQVAEFPFDSSIKRMSVVYNPPANAGEYGLAGNNSHVFTKGAVERVLDLCSHMGVGDARVEVTGHVKEQVLAQMSSLASQGQRVLAVAHRAWEGVFTGHEDAEVIDDKDDHLRLKAESGLTLLGLAGIYDPPRRETTPAIAECSTAGIKVHMLTGDHPETAKAIAKEVGIVPHNLSVFPESVASTVVMKATDFDKLSDAEVDALEELPLVIARCAPETKTRMIEALRRRNAFMAMTGDGVNDAPSLSRADVGIAMGTGSDVAKSAAKIVLTDDKFNSIVAAIREGRRMFDNVQKFILHLLSSNVGEVILLIAGLGFIDHTGYSVFPISPLEILWINMLTSSFPAFGLGREMASRDVMRKPPQDKKRGVFTNQILVDMLVYGTLMGIATLMTFVIVVYGRYDGNLGHECNHSYSEACEAVFRARAAVFAELTWLILVSAWEFKSIRRSMFRLNPDSQSRFPFFRDMYENKFLFWSVFLGAVSVFPTVYIPVLNRSVFKHTSISWEWGVVVGMTIAYVIGVETWKWIKRTWNLLDDHPVVQGKWSQGSGSESRRFTRTLSMGSIRSWKSWARHDTKISRSQSATTNNESPERATDSEVRPHNAHDVV
jgi:potassium/sodium efflux P-type ATPase